MSRLTPTERADLAALRAAIELATEDYRRLFPEPYSLPPNLHLAVRLMAAVSQIDRRPAPGPGRATAAEVILSVTRGEIDRAHGLTRANVGQIASRSFRALMPYESDAIVLEAVRTSLEAELAATERVDDRSSSASVRSISAGLPGTGRRR